MRSRINSGSVTNACQILLILSLSFSTSYAAAPPMPSSSNSTLSIEEECKSEYSKIGLCLDFATGKAKTPPKDCCATIDDIRQENEVCLCYVIQQVHQGGSSLKELGVQESKLLELPKACKLDVQLEDCPKLLHLNSTSPDNAIFSIAHFFPRFCQRDFQSAMLPLPCHMRPNQHTRRKCKGI
ncbi:hypothetical protein MKX01_025765, partial [Papaver californicum]